MRTRSGRTYAAPSVARTRAVAKNTARREINKLNPTGHEVSLSPDPWGGTQNMVPGGAYKKLVGDRIDFGTNAGDRLSNKILIKGFRYTLRISNTIRLAPPEKWFVRCLCLQGRNVTGDPTATQGALWMSDTDSLTPVDYAANDNNNLIRKVNTNRYRVLYDKKHSFLPQGAAMIDSAATPGFDRTGVLVGDRLMTGYVKLNKTLRYNTAYLTRDDAVQPNIWFIFFAQTQKGTNIASASDLKYGVRYDMYFKKQ